MRSHVYEVVVNAAPERLWRAITDVRRWPDWDRELESTEVAGELAPGRGSNRCVRAVRGAPVMNAPAHRHDRSAAAWVGVVSRAHVRRGVAGGFAQLYQGKHGPLAHAPRRLARLLLPAADVHGGAPLRAFTALGRVVGEHPYEFNMGNGFAPFRRDIAYVKDVREVSIRDIASEFDFVTRHVNWGMLARRGHFDIGMADLRRIASAMGYSPI